jgi:GNAT superfamily N-acetyltransferase
MAPPDSYEPLNAREGVAFEEFYAIYVDAIAPRERKPKAQIQAMVARDDYTILLVKRAGVTVGFSILFVPGSGSFGLLEYMAVAPALRNHGVGAGLFRRTVQSVHEKHPGAPTLLEVDSDREPSHDQPMRRRRLAFYRRLGCLRADGLRYVLPLPGEGPPPEMDLLVHAPRPLLEIPRKKLEGWLSLIYQRVYGCAPHDPRIAAMTGRLPDPVPLV